MTRNMVVTQLLEVQDKMVGGIREVHSMVDLEDSGRDMGDLDMGVLVD